MSSDRKPHPAAAYHEKRRAQGTLKVVNAAHALLDEGGLSHLTIERVAQRSGVAKTTIYRRWPDSLALARAAYGMIPEVVDLGEEAMLRVCSDPLEAAVLAASVAERLGETR